MIKEDQTIQEEEEDRTEALAEVTEEEVVAGATMAREAKRKGTTRRLFASTARRRDTLHQCVPKRKTMKNLKKQKLKLQRQLNEEKVMPKKLETDKKEDGVWYLDNGASNHMTGERSYFSEINDNIKGKVKFGDGSFVDISGKGSILFETKT